MEKNPDYSTLEGSPLEEVALVLSLAGRLLRAFRSGRLVLHNPALICLSHMAATIGCRLAPDHYDLVPFEAAPPRTPQPRPCKQAGPMMGGDLRPAVRTRPCRQTLGGLPARHYAICGPRQVHDTTTTLALMPLAVFFLKSGG